MQFAFNNGLYIAVRITGSRDNFLAVRLSETQCTPRVVPLPAIGNETAQLDRDEVLRQVEAGLLLVNQKLGKQYFVSEIQFVLSDSNSPGIYNFLIQKLIMRIDSGGKFKNSLPLRP
ncbi:MAG: hypothetical protein AAGA60_14710 [Cyanobacteria bacterium P01_E01_bin.42]